MCCHVFVLAVEAVGLAGTVGGGTVVGLAEVRVEAVLVAAVGRFVGEVDGGRDRTLQSADPRAVIAVVIVGTVDDAHRSSLVAVKSRVDRALRHTSPS